MTKKKILAVGYYIKGTGFTRVLDSMFSRLSDEYEIHLIGINYKGPIIHDKYIIYPNNLDGGDVYGACQCAERAKRLQPEIVFLLNDFWMLKNFKNALSEYKSGGGKIIAYAPLDGYIEDENILTEFDFISELVVYNQFAKEQVYRAIERIQDANYEYQFVPVSVIAHGVDTSQFSVLPNKTELKKKWFPQIQHPESAMIILNANRFDKRKRIDLCIESFASFCKSDPGDVYLYLHHAVKNDQQRDELKRLVSASGCEDRILLENASGGGYLSDADLNEVYNACEIGINTSMGEGWGMISFEHAATMAAQIIPKEPAGEELWADNAALIETKRRRAVPYSPFEMITIDTHHTTDLINQLCRDKKHREKMALKAWSNSQKRKYSWDEVSKEWSSLFERVISRDHQLINH